MIKRIKLIFDKFLLWNAVNWPFSIMVAPLVLLILFIIYVAKHGY